MTDETYPLEIPDVIMVWGLIARAIEGSSIAEKMELSADIRPAYNGGRARAEALNRNLYAFLCEHIGEESLRRLSNQAKAMAKKAFGEKYNG